MSSRGPFLVTGATGFVGSRLVRRLVGDGSDVHIIVRPESSLKEIESLTASVQIHAHDGTHTGMRRIVEESGPATVVHLAQFFRARHDGQDLRALVESNILFSTMLFDAMRECPGPRAVVQTATCHEHYENAEYNPVSLYAATKRAARTILEYYVQSERFQAVTLRLCDTYGPGDPRDKLIHQLLEAQKCGSVLEMSPGDQSIDLLHVDDVVQALLHAADIVSEMSQGTHRCFHLSSGKPIALRDLVQVFEDARKGRCRVRWGALPYRPRQMMEPPSVQSRLPGWAPGISLQQGLSTLDSDSPG